MAGIISVGAPKYQLRTSSKGNGNLSGNAFAVVDWGKEMPIFKDRISLPFFRAIGMMRALYRHDEPAAPTARKKRAKKYRMGGHIRT